MKKAHIFWVLVALVVAVGAYLLYNNGFFDGDKKEATAPLQVSLGSLVDARLYELDGGILTDVSFIPDGSIVSRVRRHDIGATASIIMPENEIGNVLVLENSGQSQQLSDASSIKDAVAISPDGAYVAYAELNLQFGSTLYSENVSDWNIKLLHVATQEVISVGVGFAPYFIGENGTTLVYSAENGIAGYDIASKETFLVLPELAVEYTVYATHVSPDGSFLVPYNSVTRKYNVFAITEASPLEISAVGNVARSFEKIAVTNNAVYGIQRNQETNEHTLWRSALSESFLSVVPEELLYTFTLDVIPYQIIP